MERITIYSRGTETLAVEVAITRKMDGKEFMWLHTGDDISSGTL